LQKASSGDPNESYGALRMGYGDLAVSIREELPMTAEQLAERIKNYYKHQKGYVKASMVVYYVEQIMKEERQNEENIHK
jgi:hypothetical protein